MKFAKIKMVALTAFVAIGASGCASTDPSEKYNYEPRVLPVVTVDAEWDDNKSYAMNKLIQMGYEPNVVDAVDLKDSAHTYSGGERFLSGALSYMGIGLMGAVADASQTKKINEEAARIPYTALLDVPDDVLKADTPQQQFIQVRDYVAQILFDAYRLSYPEAKLHLIASNAEEESEVGGFVYFTGDTCLAEKTGGIKQSKIRRGFDFSSPTQQVVSDTCLFRFELSLVKLVNEEPKVRVMMPVTWSPMLKGLRPTLSNGFIFTPPAYKKMGKVVLRGIPYIAENGVAHFFTLDNATEELKFTNNEEG